MDISLVFSDNEILWIFVFSSVRYSEDLADIAFNAHDLKLVATGPSLLKTFVWISSKLVMNSS